MLNTFIIFLLNPPKIIFVTLYKKSVIIFRYHCNFIYWRSACKKYLLFNFCFYITPYYLLSFLKFIFLVDHIANQPEAVKHILNIENLLSHNNIKRFHKNKSLCSPHILGGAYLFSTNFSFTCCPSCFSAVPLFKSKEASNYGSMCSNVGKRYQKDLEDVWGKLFYSSVQSWERESSAWEFMVNKHEVLLEEGSEGSFWKC